MNTKNVSALFQVASYFTSPKLVERTGSCMERCFSAVADTNNFLELDYSLARKIFSNLSVSLEVEVYNAVDAWIRHKAEGRIKFAEDLLSKVRLPLLSDRALSSVLKNSIFSEVSECKVIKKFKKVRGSKENIFRNKPTTYYTNRCCEQNMFNVLFFGRFSSKSNKLLKDSNRADDTFLKTSKVLSAKWKKWFCYSAVSLKGEVYVFGGDFADTHLIKTVQKYSPATGTWTEMADMRDKRSNFCCCAYLDKVMVIGGCNVNGTETDTCLQFDTKGCKWTEVAEMNQARAGAACVIFQGKIVVSGGDGRTVEAYDVDDGGWSRMPSMMNDKSNHSMVVAKNKLYAIGWCWQKCEVFDETCKRFVVLKLPAEMLESYFYALKTAVSIGSKVVMILENKSFALCYDVDTDEWSKEPCEVTKHLPTFSCVKVPRL